MSAGKKSNSRVLLVSILLIAVVGAAVGGAYYFWLKGTGRGDESSAVATAKQFEETADGQTASGVQTAAPSVKPDLVELPGGVFIIGRDDMPSRGAGQSIAYLAHMYTQWPAHAVNLAPFAIDRHEVTCAEYADFVRATGYAPPPDWNNQQTPPAGQDAWPVRNISLSDAEAFAAWRSRRDGVVYRLPTEEEWEYAARGGDRARLYPWGAEWSEGRANLSRAGQTNTVKPVGSFPEGRTPQGLDDMIGNVWEWTSSEASIYKGNDMMKVSAADVGKVVTRGGSYASFPGGGEPITATARRFTARETKDLTLGFRLVRASTPK